MEWQALPSVNWWIVISGVLWAVIWVTIVCLLVWAVSQLRRRLGRLRHQFGRLAAQPLRLVVHHYACERIRCEAFERIRRDRRGKFSPDSVGSDGHRALSMRS